MKIERGSWYQEESLPLTCLLKYIYPIKVIHKSVAKKVAKSAFKSKNITSKFLCKKLQAPLHQLEVLAKSG